jgi:hypothetical protein
MTERNLVLSKCIPNSWAITLLLTDSARQAIEQQSSLYTWNTVNRYQEEIDGLMILALVLAQIAPI